MILVYCNHITKRHRYTFDFIFKGILGLECTLTDDQHLFTTAEGARINYSADYIPGVISFYPGGLLEESGIRDYGGKVVRWQEWPVIFPVEKPSTWPFDPFSMIFYLVSRYEEYLPYEPDEHGRFSAGKSLAYREDFLHLPLVDMIVHELKKLLEKHYPGLKFPCQPFIFLPTFDIDIAFAHLGKGWTRALAAWAKLFLNADIKQLKERILTLSGKISDPYDNFDVHIELAKKYSHPLHYFVLLGDFSTYDRNTSYKSNRFRSLLKKLSLNASMGLHPSYRAHLRPDIFKEEKRRLEEILDVPVTKSRFHFLRLKFPESYRSIVNEGITDDYSLGYSTTNGFRASTCTPFFFYDLEKEEITTLRVHPFIFMDSALSDHLKMKPRDAALAITGMVDQVKKNGGEAIGIWHNYSLSEKDQYLGWQEVLQEILEKYQNPTT